MSLRLRPLDLDAAELRARRRLRSGDVVAFACGRFARVRDTEWISGELIAYRGVIIECPLGVGYSMPDPAEISFEPSHIVDYWSCWEFPDFVARWWANIERSRDSARREAQWLQRCGPTSWVSAGLGFIRNGGDPFAKRSDRKDPNL